MLKLERRLYFPRLVKIGETTFKSWGESQETTSVYELNWDEKERAMKGKHEKWLKGHHPSFNIPFMDDLPEPYNQWMRKMQYAIPVKYLREIRRCAQMAVFEFNNPRSFDTMIREICLGPGIKFVYVAFRLIADCLYDPNTEYFYRGEDKVFLDNALLYKFWMNQTGRGVVWEHAEMDRLSDRAGRMSDKDLPMKNGMRKFVRAIEKQMEYINEKFNVIYADQGTGTEEEKTNGGSSSK